MTRIEFLTLMPGFILLLQLQWPTPKQKVYLTFGGSYLTIGGNYLTFTGAQ